MKNNCSYHRKHTPFQDEVIGGAHQVCWSVMITKRSLKPLELSVSRWFVKHVAPYKFLIVKNLKKNEEILMLIQLTLVTSA